MIAATGKVRTEVTDEGGSAALSRDDPRARTSHTLLNITECETAPGEPAGPLRVIFETNPGCVKVVARERISLRLNPAGPGLVGSA